MSVSQHHHRTNDENMLGTALCLVWKEVLDILTNHITTKTTEIHYVSTLRPSSDNFIVNIIDMGILDNSYPSNDLKAEVSLYEMICWAVTSEKTDYRHRIPCPLYTPLHENQPPFHLLKATKRYSSRTSTAKIVAVLTSVYKSKPASVFPFLSHSHPMQYSHIP